jgi:hypothetical protein
VVRVVGSNGPFYYTQRVIVVPVFLDKFSVRDIRREVGPGWVGPLNKSQYLSYKMSIRWTIGKSTGKRPLGKLFYSTVFE